MERYKNLGGNSGIASYESGDDYIRVNFRDGSVYLYTYVSTGAGDIEKFEELISANGLLKIRILT